MPGRKLNKKVPVRVIKSAIETEVIEGPASLIDDNGNPQSRAVARMIEPGENNDCAHCGERIRFKAKSAASRFVILATVYDEEGNWLRHERYFPPSCYDEAEAPYGPVFTMSPQDGIDAGIIPSLVEIDPVDVDAVKIT